MGKKYKIKKSKELIEKLKPYWIAYEKIEDKFYNELGNLETEMETYTNIKNIEFFFADTNECVGIGNVSRDMELIHREELSDD